MTKHSARKNLSLLSAISILTFAASTLAADLPSEPALQALFDQKNYRGCLQQTARVLNLQGPPAAAYDRFTLQMRRGECFLNLADYPTAIYAFNAALTAAPSPSQAEQARALIALIQASDGPTYRPRRAPTDPINIVSPDTRAAAMKACFTDQFAARTEQIKNAQTTTSLAPIIAFVPQAQDLHALEIAGFGADPQSRPAFTAIGEQARTVITDALKSLNTQISTIEARANQLYASWNSTITAGNGATYFVGDTRAGLSPQDRDTLRQLLPYLNQISQASTRGKQIAQSVGATGAAWDPVIAEANRVSQHAQSVLAAE
jgi:hypothetical protein